jgi:hypothetical protein
MFQISAGVFFEESKIEKHEGTFVFYSNVDMFFPMENESPYFKVNKISHDGVNCYVVNYILLTEKPERIEAGTVIRAGDQDYIQQFILLWEFYFDCVARLEKESVKKICAQANFNKHYSKIAFEVAPHLVEINRDVSFEAINGFKCFINHVVSIERTAFNSVIAALKIISDSKESLSTNFDLTYSMLIYALESLSQRNDKYHSSWDDYDQKTKGDLELVFENISVEDAERIKTTLIEGKQFKLQKRFKDFILENIDDNFFYEKGASPIRSSFMNRSLDNLYKIRSSFVHELKPLDAMLSQAHKPIGDCLVIFGEPYFSYSGLLRLLSHVIRNFCRKKCSNEKESINWVMETSGVMVMEISAIHWLWNPDSFKTEYVAKWYCEYLNMLNLASVTNLQSIMRKIETNYDQSKQEYKNGLLSFYYLYNLIHNRDDDKWIEFVNKRDAFLIDDMYWYSGCLYLYDDLASDPNSVVDDKMLDKFRMCFNEYDKNKFKKNHLNLPAMTEVGMLVCAANSYYKLEMYQDYKFMAQKAMKEISSINIISNYIEDCLSKVQYISLEECFRLYRSK